MYTNKELKLKVIEGIMNNDIYKRMIEYYEEEAQHSKGYERKNALEALHEYKFMDEYATTIHQLLKHMVEVDIEQTER